MVIPSPDVLHDISQSMKKCIYYLTTAHCKSFSHGSTFHILTQVMSPIFKNVPQHALFH